ncbi:MAG: LysR family transcriptional regulator [Pseudomonadota bacterium]
MPNLEDLETFVAVADTGGVSSAARRLGLPKSIVSRRLGRLETELGAQLLTRNTRGAALTEAGATFREHAARAVAEIDAARESVSPNGELRGLLRISVPMSLGITHLGSMFAQFAARHPLLQLHVAYGDRKVDLISEGFDMAIRIGYLQDSGLIARRVGEVAAALVASPDYVKTHGAPKTLEDLQSHPALMQGTESWRFRDGEKIVVVHPQGKFKADVGFALVAAALAGLGVIVLPGFLADEHLASGKLVRLLPEFPIPEAGLYIVRPPGAHPPRKVRVLMDFLLEQFAPMCAAQPH